MIVGVISLTGSSLRYYEWPAEWPTLLDNLSERIEVVPARGRRASLRDVVVRTA